MARVAVAYVEIRPDLGEFAEKLRAELAAVKDSLTIKIEADTKAFTAELKTKLGEAKAQSVGVKIESIGIPAFFRELRRKLDEYDVRYQVQVEPTVAGFYTQLQTELKALRGSQVRVNVSPDLKGFRTELKTRIETMRPVPFPITPDMRGFRRELRARVAAMKPIPIPVVPDIATFRAVLRATFLQALEREGLRAGRRAGRSVGDEMGRTVAGRMLRSFAQSLGRYNFATVLAGGLLKGLASMADSIGEALSGVVRLGSTATHWAGLGFTSAMRTEDAISDMAAAIAGAVSSVGSLAGGFIALAAAAALTVTIMGALQLVLGAILAVIIPLVGAVAALVAALAQIGGIITASLGLLPAALGATLAAFGPLISVADKFSKLMEDTAEHTGELFAVVEKLRNAIFAVISSGFVETVKDFADNVLPELLGGIDAVAQAWNRFLKNVFAVLSAKQVVADLNVVLRMGAMLVEHFGDAFGRLLPALLTMAAVAAPAFAKILASLTELTDAFAVWVDEMAESGQMAGFFNQLAEILDKLVYLMPQLAELMGNWLTAIMPAALGFLDVLLRMTDLWQALTTGFTNQTGIMAFFDSMNRTLESVLLMITFVIEEFMGFGPTLARLVEGAAPAFEALVDVLFKLLEDLAPHLITFLDMFAANLSDPDMQASLAVLVDSVGALLRTMGERENMVMFLTALTAAVDVFNAVGAAAQFAYEFTLRFINDCIWIWNKFVDATNRIIDDINSSLGWLGVNLDHLEHVVAINVDSINRANVSMGNTAVSATNAAMVGLQAYANAHGWQVILNNASKVSEAAAAVARGVRIGALQAQYAGLLQTSGVSGAFSGGYSAPVTTKMASVAKSAGQKAGKATAAGFISTLTAALSDLKATDLIKQSSTWLKAGINIARYIAKGITSGTANINKVGAYIAKKFPSYIKSIQTWITRYKAAATPFVKELGKKLNVDQLNTLLDQIKDFKQKAFEALTPHRDLVGVFGFIPTPAEVRNQLQLQLDTMRAFTSQLEALQRKGLSKDLAAAWLQAGAETAGNLVQGLQDAAPEQIAEINRLYGQIGTEATKTADSQATQFYKVGQSTVEGLIKGIASQQAAAVKAIDAILDAALAAAKKKLGIKSPSAVFDLLGVNTVVGYIQGMESKTNATVAAVEGLYGQVTGVPPAALAVPTVRPGYASTAALLRPENSLPPQVNVRVYLGSKEITDILRVQVDDYDTTRARALLAGRRGG